MSQQGNGGGMFVAFIAGAIAGAAVALLYAPATGDETRVRERIAPRKRPARVARYSTSSARI